MNTQVTLRECFTRDGLQYEPGFIATTAKRAPIERFAALGSPGVRIVVASIARVRAGAE